MGQNNNQLQPMMPTGVATPAILPVALQPYSPTRLSATFAEVRTVEQALAVKAPSFGSLVRQGKASKEELERLIMQHLVVMDAYLKQKNGLTPEEIASIAEEVVAKYYWVLTFADICVIFRNARNGEYGELYNTITASKVLGWFAQYEQERCQKCEELALSRSKEEKSVNSDKELATLGYRINEQGQVTNVNPPSQKKTPNRYIYDEKGNIKGENPAYWAAIRNKEEQTKEGMEKINKQNRVMERVHELIKANPSIGYINAVNQAISEIEGKTLQDNG